MRVSPIFRGIRVGEEVNEYASYGGVAAKTAILLGIAVFSGIIAPYTFINFPWLFFVFIIAAIVSGIAGQFSSRGAAVWGIIYAISEGSMLGLVSFCFELDPEIQGIVLTAIILTATVFCSMLLLYSTKAIRVTNKFLKFMSAIGISILVISLIYWISSLVNPNNMFALAFAAFPGIIIGIGLFVLLYGALMLVIDFARIDDLVQSGFDKKYEWNAALGLMITIIWIYVEILRILAILAKSRK